MEHVATEVSRPRRKSAFRETGLFDDERQLLDNERQLPLPLSQTKRPALRVRFRSSDDLFEHNPEIDQQEDVVESDTDSEVVVLTSPVVSPAKSMSMAWLVRRLSLVALVLAIAIPITHFAPSRGSKHPILGATGVPIAEQPEPIFEEFLTKRADSSTDYCKRWSQQSGLPFSSKKRTQENNMS
jgi:hypothetical protein